MRFCAVTCSLLIANVCFLANTHAKELTVSFHLDAPSLPKDATVYVTGGATGLGNWQPDAKQMTYAGDHSWTYRLSLSKPQTIEYKYTLGSWAREGADAGGKPLANFTLEVSQSTEVRNRVDRWTEREVRRAQGQITGDVRYHRQLTGEDVRPRDIVVWLPPGYEDSNQRYPVLYMHDGQNLFDPATSAFGVDWQVDESCTKLIEAGEIPPLIVVGIYNTRDRSREYLPDDAGRGYRQFVVQTVKPLVDRQYRTKPDRENTLVGGSSAGGLCAMILLWEHHDVFSKAICMSPAFRIEKEGGSLKIDYVSHVQQSPRPSEPIAVYISNGDVGLEEKLQPGVDAMLATLKEKGLHPTKNLHWLIDHTARHTESAWAKRFPNAILTLLPAE